VYSVNENKQLLSRQNCTKVHDSVKRLILFQHHIQNSSGIHPPSS